MQIINLYQKKKHMGTHVSTFSEASILVAQLIEISLLIFFFLNYRVMIIFVDKLMNKLPKIRYRKIIFKWHRGRLK